MIREDDIVLFQGDSITAGSRNLEQKLPNIVEGLGQGYVLHVSAALLCDVASRHLRIFNRGISGNRLLDLSDRWQKDCVDLRPTVVSILIGINDVVQYLGQAYEVYATEFETVYRNLLRRTVHELPGVRLVVCEPFALEQGEVTAEWLPILRARQRTARVMSIEFGAIFVPFQAALDHAYKEGKTDYLTEDGVHPTLAGQEIMARSWLDSIAE